MKRPKLSSYIERQLSLSVRRALFGVPSEVLSRSPKVSVQALLFIPWEDQPPIISPTASRIGAQRA